MTDFEHDILYLLRDPEARFNVQRLDRALMQRWDAATVVQGLMPALRSLEAAGLVAGVEHQTDRARYTLYGSTDAGRREVNLTSRAVGAD